MAEGRQRRNLLGSSLSSAVRYQHATSGMSGMIAQPPVEQGSMAAWAIRVLSAGYIALFGIDDSEQMLEASCLQNISAVKHATLMCGRDGSVPVHARCVRVCGCAERAALSGASALGNERLDGLMKMHFTFRGK